MPLSVSFSRTVIQLFAALIAVLFPEPICRMLGANDLLLADSITYLKILLLFSPACMLQTLFQCFLVTAGAPHMGLILTILAGLVNAVMDYVLIVPCQLGIGGAAMATGLGQTIPAVIGLVFFLSPRHELHLTRFSFRVKNSYRPATTVLPKWSPSFPMPCHPFYLTSS